MKKLLIILLTLLAIETKAQITEFYVRSGTQAHSICSLQPSNLVFEKKRITFTSPGISLDLKIKKRKKSVWYGETKDKQKYQIFASLEDGHFRMLFVSGEQFIAISNKDFCR